MLVNPSYESTCKSLKAAGFAIGIVEEVYSQMIINQFKGWIIVLPRKLHRWILCVSFFSWRWSVEHSPFD